MNKFFNKLVYGILSLTIISTPVRTEANVLDLIATGINTVGFGLAIHGYRIIDKNTDNQNNQEALKYAVYAIPAFAINLLLNLYNLLNEPSKIEKKKELEEKVKSLEVENKVLRSAIK